MTWHCTWLTSHTTALPTPSTTRATVAPPPLLTNHSRAANNNTHLPIEPGKEGSTMPIDMLRERLIDGPHHCMKYLDVLIGLEIAMGTCPLLIHWYATIALLSWHRVQQQHNNWSHIGKHRVESRSHWQKQSIPRKLCHSIHQRTMPYCSPAADTTTSYERPLSRSHGVQG